MTCLYFIIYDFIYVFILRAFMFTNSENYSDLLKTSTYSLEFLRAWAVAFVSRLFFAFASASAILALRFAMSWAAFASRIARAAAAASFLFFPHTLDDFIGHDPWHDPSFANLLSCASHRRTSNTHKHTHTYICFTRWPSLMTMR